MILVLAMAGATTGDGANPPVGYQWLNGLDYLWQYSGAVHTAMSSSTDPAGGNMDMSQFHGKYRGEKILAKIDGPGCVYRIWSAAPSGILKVYLDGSTKPAINCGFKNYLEGKCSGLPADFTLGRWANYMPIPFAKSIVITAPGFTFPGYYQVSYQTYDPSVKVESFKKEAALSFTPLEKAPSVFLGGKLNQGCDGLESAEGTAELAPGADAVALDLSGAGVIRRLSVKKPEGGQASLEGLKIMMYWDGSDAAAVDAPLDAFFVDRFELTDQWPGGSLAGIFVTGSDEGNAAWFPMPFASGARVAIMNPGDTPRSLKLRACYEKLPALPPSALRFHAEYRDKDYPSDLSPERTITSKTVIDPATNYVVLERQGRGNYVGCAIFVKSVGTVWWGEGDEMTYIDGAREPQIRGTGTEDELNWSWGFNPHMSLISGTLPVVPECKESIAAQLIPQLRNPECNKLTGENIAYRFRPSDYVPFASSIKVSYELLGQSWAAPNGPVKGNLSQNRGDDYASMAYWYEAP